MKTDLNITVNGDKATWNITRPLLTKGSSNHKTAKSEKFKDGIYSTMLLHLSPGKISGYNTCPNASEGCKAICLNQAGQGGCNKDHKLVNNTCHVARVGRTVLLKKYKRIFFAKLKMELQQFVLDCEIKGSFPCIRLNGTSDLNWVKMKDPATGKNLMTLFPNIQFYDYTKDIKQLENLPKNYDITFSRSENNFLNVTKALSKGFNVAVVFDKKMGLPDTYMGYPVFDADQTDLRFLDADQSGFDKPLIAGLVEKGYLARHDRTGFVVREADLMKSVA